MKTETWKVVPNHPGYEVSDRGRLRNCRRGRLVALRTNKGGYLVADVWTENRRRSRPIHQLVLEAFVGPCPAGMMGRHLDGDKQNNAPANLAWGTSAENADDRIKHALSVIGLHDQVRYAKARATIARALLDNGVSARDVWKGLGYHSLQEMHAGLIPGYYRGQRRTRTN